MRSIRRTWERIRNVPGIGRDVVALAALAAVALACSGYIFVQYAYESPFAERLVISAEFEKAPGVRPESRQEVRIAGVTVGKIVSADLEPNGNATLVMSLEPGHQVYSNARAMLRTKAPLNIMYVALDPGGPPAEPLRQGGVLPPSQTERPVQLFETLEKLDERTQVAVTSLINQADAALVQAPEHLPEGLRESEATMAAFRPVLEQLRTRRETIAHLVTSLAEISAAVGKDDRRLANLTSSLHQTLGVIAKRDGELGDTLRQIPGFSHDLRTSMRSVSTLTGELNPTLDALDAASGELPDALSRLSKTVKTVGEVVDRASPVVAKAKPVVADMRPFARDLNGAFSDLVPVTRHLPQATTRIVPWLEDLSAFIYHTSSAFSLADVNGGWGRALLTLDVTNPAGGLKPQPDTGKGAGR